MNTVSFTIIDITLSVMIGIVGGDNVRKYWPHYFAGAQGIVRNTLFMSLCLLKYIIYTSRVSLSGKGLKLTR